MDRFLIDTDILSYYFKGDPDVVNKFNQYLDQYDLIEISLVTYYEITSGLLAKNALKQLTVFEDFVAENIVIPLTEKSVKISCVNNLFFNCHMELANNHFPLTEVILMARFS